MAELSDDMKAAKIINQAAEELKIKKNQSKEPINFKGPHRPSNKTNATSGRQKTVQRDQTLRQRDQNARQYKSRRSHYNNQRDMNRKYSRRH